MKICLTLLILLFTGLVFGQKMFKAGDKQFVVTGDTLFNYPEQFAGEDSPRWIESYIRHTKDSVIFTRLWFSNKASKTPDAIDIYSINKNVLDFSGKSVDIWEYSLDAFVEPAGAKQLTIHVKSGKKLNITSWSVDQGYYVPTMDFIQFTVKDQIDAMNLLEKIKKTDN